MRPGIPVAAYEHHPVPVLAVCGWSGSGKTTLLETIIPVLVGRHLRVAVVKHDAHRIDVDRPGKDSDRLYRAGADVVLQGPEEALCRRHQKDQDDNAVALPACLLNYDLVLVEGHKDTPLPKVWLASATDPRPPEGTESVLAVLGWGGARFEGLLNLLDVWLPRVWRGRPVYGGILIDGLSARTIASQQAVPLSDKDLVQHAVAALRRHVACTVLLGSCEVSEMSLRIPRLPVSPTWGGPIAPMLSAMQWAPGVTWVFAAADLPLISDETIAWLVQQRAPGKWIVLPCQSHGADQPRLVMCEPQARPLIERLARQGLGSLRSLAHLQAVVTPEPPAPLACS